MKADTRTVKVRIEHPDMPTATLDGGVWHCVGRLVTRDTAKAAYEEALFWLAIASAERLKQDAEATK